MVINGVDFLIGLGTGMVLGTGVTLAAVKIRGLFKNSEIRRLRDDVHHLQRRLKEKDRHISRMLVETEKLVDSLSQIRVEPPSQLQ